jgi:hypothetical protein
MRWVHASQATRTVVQTDLSPFRRRVFQRRKSYTVAMGGMPPQEQKHEGRDERAALARGLSVGHLLGEEWRSDGDGIYRLVTPAEPVESAPAERGVVAAPDDVDDLIAELSADLGRR